MQDMSLCPAFARSATRREDGPPSGPRAGRGRTVPALASALVALGGALTACSPALDWRTVRHDAAAVEAVLPCKPERATREVPLLGPGQPPVALHMLSCRAAGHTFAVAAVRLPDGAGDGTAAQWLAAWRRAAWATLRVPAPADGVPPGWAAVPCGGAGPATLPPSCWRGPGHGPDGQPLQAEWHWRVEGPWLVQRALYGPGLADDARETFFGGVTRHGSGR